jgi:hypothetical protein
MPPALPIEMVPMLLSTGASARSTDVVAARFRAGDAVVARNINPVGHTRLPRYIKGKRGVIRADHGVFTFPDTAAHRQGHKPQHLYSVRFMAQELWGDAASPRDSVYIDLFDDYMDADPAASDAATDAPAGAQVRPLGSRASRRSARPERDGGARKKPRKARRPGVRVQKAAAKSQATAPARAGRKAAAIKKKKAVKKRRSAAKAPRARVVKPARAKKKARAARS